MEKPPNAERRRPKRASLESTVQSVPLKVRRDFEKLASYRDEIESKLKSEEFQNLFRDRPDQALESVGAKLGPSFKKALRRRGNPLEVLAGRSFVLPNGQSVTPKVNIRITGSPSR